MGNFQLSDKLLRFSIDVKTTAFLYMVVYEFGLNKGKIDILLTKGSEART